jgi:hypothetical protein
VDRSGDAPVATPRAVPDPPGLNGLFRAARASTCTATFSFLRSSGNPRYAPLISANNPHTAAGSPTAISDVDHSVAVQVEFDSKFSETRKLLYRRKGSNQVL